MFESHNQFKNDLCYQETNENNIFLNKRLSFQHRHIDQKIISDNRNYFKEMKKNNQLKVNEAYFKEKCDKAFWIVFHILSNVINVLNVIIYIIQSYTDKDQKESGRKVNKALSYCDIIFASYFVLEFAIMCYKNNNIPIVKRIVTIETFIDFITIVPSILLFTVSNKALRIYLRAIAVIRILRIYKSIKILQSDSLIDIGKNLSKIMLQFILIIIIFISLFLISTGLLLGLQDLFIDAFNIRNLTFMDALFFIVVTTTTLGYGDIYPTNIVSRIYIIILIISFISVLSFQITQLIQLFQLIGNSSKYEIENHVILIMDKNIDLNLVLREIKKENHRKQVIIITKDKEVLPSNEYPFNKVYLIQSEEINFEILQRVNTKCADYLIVFANMSLDHWEQSEKINEFIVFKIIQYYSNIPIYVQSLFNDKSFLCEISKKKDAMFPFMENQIINDLSSNSRMIIKNIVPIFKIKSLIMGKAIFNPGFANFAQNLVFNDSKINFDLEGFDLPMQAHFLGCENTIVINELPRAFVGLEFYDAMRLIYSASVRDYLVKVNVHNIKDINRPVILIGIVDKTNPSNQILFYPKDYIIHRRTMGIFISYDGDKYLESILKRVNMHSSLITKENEDSFQEEKLKQQKTQKRMGFSETPSMNSVKAFNSQMSYDLRRTRKKNNNQSEDNVDSSENNDVNDNPIHEVNQLVSSIQRTNSLKTEREEEPNKLIAHSLAINTNNDVVLIKANSTNPYANYDDTNSNNNDQRKSLGSYNHLSLKLNFLGKRNVQLVHTNNKTKNAKDNNDFTIQSAFLRTKTFEINDYDQHKIEKKIAKTINDAELIEKQIEKESNEKDINFFLAKKNQIFKGRNELNDFKTQKNMLFIEAFSEHNLHKFLAELTQTIQRRYQSDSVMNRGFTVENKQFDCAKDDISTIIANHILIVGYQDGFDKLITIIKLHYPYKDICIMTSYSVDDNLIIKHIKEYKSIYHLKGEIDNPFHLINAGIGKASYVIFLIEKIYSKANEDIEKILGFRALDYYFQTNILLEIWDHLSISFLGYNPVINHSIIGNELLHPLYMAGKLLYLDHFSRVVCMSAKDSLRIEAWYELMNIGYKSKVTTSGEGYISLKRGTSGYPVIVTIDLPERFIGKEFFTVVTDLMCQRKPMMILGIYIETPLLFLKTKSEGTIRAANNQVNILASHKRKLSNVSAFNKKEQDYFVNLFLLKNISCNDRIVLDYSDLNHPFLPMFITNPPPCYVLTKGTKLLLLSYHEPLHQNNLSVFQKELASFSRRTRMNGTGYMGTGVNQQSKLQLGCRQDNFFQTLAVFKEKISERYKNAYKQIEK